MGASLTFKDFQIALRKPAGLAVCLDEAKPPLSTVFRRQQHFALERTAQYHHAPLGRPASISGRHFFKNRGFLSGTI